MLGLGRQQPTCRQVKGATEFHLAAVRSQVAELQKVEAILSCLVEACSGDESTDCVVVASLKEPSSECCGDAISSLKDRQQ